MIHVDPRDGSKGHTTELRDLLRRLNIKTDNAMLDFGDACFEGNGPRGRVLIGVERKRLHDMLNCIDDARYAAHQRLGMLEAYGINFLIIEGVFKPKEPDGILMEGFNGMSWGECRYRSQRVMYSKLRRYLFSISLSGVHVLYTRDIWQTAYDIHELYHYFQKRWDDHTSLRETQKLAIPSLREKPALVRKWASDIEGIGVKLGEDAARLFRTPIKLANADEVEWLKIRGIGVPTAQAIVREIRGGRL